MQKARSFLKKPIIVYVLPEFIRGFWYLNVKSTILSVKYETDIQAATLSKGGLIFYERNWKMYQQTEYEILLEEKRELVARIYDLMGDIDFFPDESDHGINEWSPGNETEILWASKIEGDIGKLEARKREINKKMSVLKRQGCRTL